MRIIHKRPSLMFYGKDLLFPINFWVTYKKKLYSGNAFYIFYSPHNPCYTLDNK